MALQDPQLREAIFAAVPPQYIGVLTVVLGFVSAFLHRVAVEHNPDGAPVGAPYSWEAGRSLVRARTDRHNNPILATVSMARRAGVFFLVGEPTPDGEETARFLGDPIGAAIAIIDTCGFGPHPGVPDWGVGMSYEEWDALDEKAKVGVVHSIYNRLGGHELEALFWWKES
jgi:hypothetical protein